MWTSSLISTLPIIFFLDHMVPLQMGDILCSFALNLGIRLLHANSQKLCASRKFNNEKDKKFLSSESNQMQTQSYSLKYAMPQCFEIKT